MTKSEAQQISLAQNATKALYKAVDLAIKTAAGLGNYSAVYTLSTAEQPLATNLEVDLTLRGFGVVVTGDDDEIYTISFDTL